MLKVTVCGLFYGSNRFSPVKLEDGSTITYEDMHKRCLDSMQHTPVPGITADFCFGLNCVNGLPIESYVDKLTDVGSQVHVEHSDVNICKCPMMRRMFDKVFDSDASWVIWLDDDSYFTDPSWLSKLGVLLQNYEIDVLGEMRWMTYAQQQKHWVKGSYWYRGLPLQTNATGDEGINFPVGGFWAARTKVLKAINWPDSRIRHKGDDVMFGEAVRQNKYAAIDITPHNIPVVINGAERRGFDEIDAGMRGDE